MSKRADTGPAEQCIALGASRPRLEDDLATFLARLQIPFFTTQMGKGVVDETERGRGLGRAAMLALEAKVKELGYASVGLNVWGGNDVARALYRKLGYTEQSVGMTKTLESK